MPDQVRHDEFMPDQVRHDAKLGGNRHPGLDPGSTFFVAALEGKGGCRIKSGMTNLCRIKSGMTNLCRIKSGMAKPAASIQA
ncbi:MAG TPA: hypothetical protein VF650_03090 [Allosphingosinicella sp.]|jgi:hypothetical protein